MPLTDITIKSAKLGAKPVRMFDGGGGCIWKFPRLAGSSGG
jgi:hypothetical protein